MDPILKERDRLLQRTARICGLSFTVVAALCLVLPDAVTPATFLPVVPLVILLAAAQYVVGFSRSYLWVLVQVATVLGIVASITTLNPDGLTPAALSSVFQFAAASLPSIALVLATDRVRLAVLAAVFVVVTGLTTWLTADARPPLQSLGILSLGWVIAAVAGIWVSAGVPQAARRIASIGRAHRAERQASEIEAQRRQSARLLHDTVLATLTLLAHSGVGVAPAALQQQSADDAKLLRQLRLGATPAPLSSGGYNLEPVEETVLGTTLESVKQRFGRMGLEVSWHGTGQVLLPSDVLDAFLLALAECLENVRRHSGVREAHVTIVDDATTVRAMITDAGVGFILDDVDSARLGFKESVVARLKEVGGHARLFSEPGSGTTVVLEVPR
ncbi:sensor histidine kinase [Conyzicola sp.]|uniref:sensor histidine kinase n=1 Tax=Conyzicola sp. TaxID=1969404 RepID=UPI003988F884